MQINVVKDEGAKLKLKIKGTSVGVMNALRRTILSELDAFAIDEVDFYENNSSLFNEYIANRLALIPLTYEESHAEKTEISLSLNAEGPCMVYSRDLKSSDETIKIFNENIPIIKLAANQKLRLEAKIAKGKTKSHAKFQSAICSYEYDPEKKAPEFEVNIESFNNITAAEQMQRALAILKAQSEMVEKDKELK